MSLIFIIVGTSIGISIIGISFFMLKLKKARGNFRIKKDNYNVYFF
jgi:hypothetical protein